MIILQTYLKLIRCHALVHLMSPVDAYLIQSTYFILHLPDWLFLWLVCEVDTLPIVYPPSSEAGFCTGILFLQGVWSDTLDITSCWLLSRVQSGHIEGRRNFRALTVWWVAALLLRGVLSTVLALRSLSLPYTFPITGILVTCLKGDPNFFELMLCDGK